MQIAEFIQAFAAAKAAGLNASELTECFKAFQALNAATPAVPAPTTVPDVAVVVPDDVAGVIPRHVRKAIMGLAELDSDRTRRRNGVGFSRLTGRKGHALAKKFKIRDTLTGWTAGEERDARWVFRTHQKQIDRLGL